MELQIGNNKIDYEINLKCNNELYIISSHVVDVKDNIISIGEFNITKGDCLDIIQYSSFDDKEYKHKFQLNNIFRVNEHKIVCREFFRNKSFTYLSPIVGLNSKELSINNYLLNTYLDESLEYIYYTFRFYPFKWYNSLNEVFKLNKYYVCTETSKDKRFDYFKFKIPNEFKNEIKTFLAGQYHLFSEKYKIKIITFHNEINKHSRLFKILSNDEELRLELSIRLGTKLPKNIGLDSKPNKEDEIWRK